MTEALLSNAWYRVATVRPRLRDHARLHRMRYRGVLWYLLQDPISNRVHRFSPQARFVMAAMDGQRSVQQLWELANRQLGEQAPTQDEVIRLLGQLHAADLLLSDATPDATELFERAQRQQRQTRQRSWMNPLSIRMHLWDPDALLNRMRAPIDWLWGRWGGLLWLAVVLPALLLLPLHWDGLTGNFSDRLLATNNLVMLVLVFPLIKALHEWGHAAAVKRGGGEVHDLGMVLMVLMPVPYVEASASTVFKSKLQRAVVGASGMAVELFVAALAFYLWMLLEPSLLRAVLFNVMVVAGVSTLVFNGNPLLRFDAYYILSDLLEMPNLAARSMRYLGYLVERYAFGVRDAHSPETQRSEKAWLVAYGVLSFVYRIFVTISIALFIAGEFFIVGVLLAVWAVATMALLPLVKSVQHLAASPRLHAQRQRVWGVTFGALAVLALLLLVLPAPQRTVVEGVAWLPESALVRTAQDGFVRRVLATPGAAVLPGDALVALDDAALRTAHRVSQAKVAELEAVYTRQLVQDRALAAIAQEQLQAEHAALRVLAQRVENLVVRAATAGTFMLPQAQDLEGRFFRQGDLLGYVLDQPQPLARVVVSQQDADAVRSATTGVQLRPSHQSDWVLHGHIAREVPSGAEYLPSRALAAEGGGQLATDPRDAKGARTLERTFQFDVAVDTADAPGQTLFFGERVRVRFDHPAEPLGLQWMRSVRALFLSHFHV